MNSKTALTRLNVINIAKIYKNLIDLILVDYKKHDKSNSSEVKTRQPKGSFNSGSLNKCFERF